MDEADLQAIGEVKQQSTRHRRRPRGQAIGRAEDKLCTERTQFRLSESYVLATSTKGQVAPVSGGLEFNGRHSTFGAGDPLVAIDYHQVPKLAKVVALKIKRSYQRCASHANAR
jgi:hypothetical protein